MADVITQRKLDENTTDGIIAIELLYDIHNLVYSCLCRKGYMLVVNADLLGGLQLHADINTRVGSRTRLYYGQVRLKAGVFGLECIYPLGNVVAK